ncbi:hypothetical protein [Variovorax sp. JS1663]|uniref:hypothetical protein n=1 Tax=Variovorax sp. JS1663 TaxID=1851577 RepID=UPI00117E0025|nr:hypothetical protein [Variovorax sp. JS1663]
MKAWGIKVKTQRSSYIDPASIRRTKREAWNTWWKANVTTPEDWDMYNEMARNGELVAVKVEVKEPA